MSIIYEPKGKAREYSPLALNYYKGCDHGCTFCYVPNIFSRNKDYNHAEVKERDILKQLENDCKKQITDQVLLSFTGDPYCNYNDKAKLTRKVLEILLKYQVPTAILTKGGLRCLQDLDLFKKFQNIKIGATLTFDNDFNSQKTEPNAALPSERIEALKILHKNNIKTFVSIEPVIYPEQSLNLIKQTISFVDQYKIGKLNHNKEWESKIDWSKFLDDVVNLMHSNNKQFYIKTDLLKFKNGTDITDNETDMNYLCLKKTITAESEMILF